MSSTIQGGKSTQLAEIKWKLKEKNHLVVEVDTQLLSEHPGHFYTTLAFQIATTLRIPKSKAQYPHDRKQFQSLFQDEGMFTITMTEQKKTGFILLFEEMDGLRCKEEFWSALSPLLETNQKELTSLSICGSQQYVITTSKSWTMQRTP
jgi:hypothetical protein